MVEAASRHTEMNPKGGWRVPKWSATRKKTPTGKDRNTRSAGYRRAERTVVAVVVVVGLLGIALTVIALLLATRSPSTPYRVIAGVAGSFAGALVGASIGFFVNKGLNAGALEEFSGLNADTLNEIRELIGAASRDSLLTSPEAELAPLRKEWHHYHRTYINRRKVWRYCIMDFDNRNTVGTLTATVKVQDVFSTDVSHVFRVEGALRGGRLILTQERLEANEGTIVEIFPTALEFAAPVHVGVAIMQSWDGPDILTPTLISRKPLYGTRAEGTADEADWPQLDVRYQQEFVKVKRLLT
jgi:hypothetical protein